MLGRNQSPVEAKDFKTGLVTRSDIINPNPDQSPNCMDIQWYFDDSIGKRLGSTTTNTIVITSGGPPAGWIINGGGNLNTNLQNYWDLNEASGVRDDAIGESNLNPIGNTPSDTGIRNLGGLFGPGSALSITTDNSLILGASNMTISCWFYFNQAPSGTKRIIGKGINSSFPLEYSIGFNEVMGSHVTFSVASAGNGVAQVTATSFGSLTTGTWYNIVAWKSNNSHIGISVNRSTNTAAFTASAQTNMTLYPFAIGAAVNSANVIDQGALDFGSRVDEVGVWKRVLTALERNDLYGGGSANTYSSSATSSTEPWASFDFGAGVARWLTVAIGTGILASSNRGTTFVNIASSRTSNYQYLDRSRNVLIATSDSYDQTLYWAGSAGTFAVALAVNSAPKAKFSINYQGFLVLLNSTDSNGTISNRRFSYADENLQLTSSWPDGFDLPSSADDEITGPFILNKFLYVSTKYRIFRLAYTGGNPDWQYIQVKNFGYVPRTIKVFTLKQGQVAVGLDWSRRLRAFDGYDDQIISDNVENAGYCEFAMQNISLAGSGLIVSNAEFDTNEQEYRLNLTIGAQSTQTTHALVLNARTLALYPYSNQPFNTMCMAESAGQQYLMAFDRSGFCHVMNSGNTDVTRPINEVYDSPILFKTSPSEVSKNKHINFYFSVDSCGTVHYQERFDFSNVYSSMRPLRDYNGQSDMLGTESALQLIRTVDLPSVQNVYQFRLTSSAGTANPWVLNHFDLFNSTLGFGRGK